MRSTSANSVLKLSVEKWNHHKYIRAITTLIIFLAVLLLLISLFYTTPKSQPNPNPIVMKELNERTYKEWEQLLHSDIISINEIDSTSFNGLSKKYEIIFSSGHIGIGRKLKDFKNFIKPGFEVISIQDAGVPEEMYPRRANREYQVWAEYASSVIANILNMKYRKLPSVLRDVSAIHYQRDEGGIFSFINRIFANIYLLFHYWDDHYVESSKDWMLIEPFLDNIQYSPPPHFYLPFLAQKPAFLDSRYTISKGLAGQISDLLVFDLIVEDPDRYLSHNWISDRTGNLVFWDSGLSFSHGPLGRSTYLDLLCGPKEWRDHGRATKSNILANTDCLHICKFRNQTLQHLISLDRNKDKGKGIMSLFRNAIEKEKINVLEENLYYSFISRWPKVKYRTTDFYVGLEQKLVRFLSHVDHCVEEFGYAYVFDTELD